MTTTKYLIVGGGMTGDMAAKGIREHDADGRIVVVGADPHPVYKRPLLTKGLWQGAPEEKLWREPADGVDVVTEPPHRRARPRRAHGDRRLGRGVRVGEAPPRDGRDAARDSRRPTAWCGSARSTTTGSSARRRPTARAFVVIGGGFIGSEIAAALVGAGVNVTMVFPEHGIGARLFPAGLAEFLVDYYREKGVEVLSGETVSAASGRA